MRRAPRSWFPLAGWLAISAPACEQAPVDTEPEDTEDSPVLTLAAAPIPDTTTPLVDHDAWVKVPAVDDPWSGERPPVVYCDPPAWDIFYEPPHLDVYTELCNYLMLAQPTLADVFEGDTISFLVDVQPIIPADPAVAHFALLLGDDVLWDVHLDVPTTNQLYRISVAAPRDAPVGTPLAIHFHNHGVNSWQLYAVTVGDSPLRL